MEIKFAPVGPTRFTALLMDCVSQNVSLIEGVGLTSPLGNTFGYIPVLEVSLILFSDTGTDLKVSFILSSLMVQQKSSV